MKSARARQSALLGLLAIGATAGVLLFDERTLARAIAGIVLALLPWAAAARLEIIRRIDLPGGRFAAAGGLTLAGFVLLGLLLTVTNIGLSEESAAIGIGLIAVGLTLAGHRSVDDGLAWPRLSPLETALLLVAAAIVVVAFALARGGALESAREASGYAAFIVGDDQKGQRLGLRNATERAARFTVQVTSKGRSKRTVLGILPNQLRLLSVPGGGSGEFKIRVVVRVDGHQKGRAMTLFTSGLS